MHDQATTLRGLMERRRNTLFAADEATSSVGACAIAVTSGKGGVGKTNIALNLAIALSQLGERVCLLDANLGLGNVDLLCGLNGYWNLSHVVTGARTVSEILLAGPAGIDVIPGASGLCDVADCPPEAQREILAQLGEIETSHDVLIIDTGTGIHRAVRRFVSAADVVLVVTTPEPTSIADAYATIKSLSGVTDRPEIEILVNQAIDAEQGTLVADRIRQTTRLFLQFAIESAGWIPHDPAVVQAVIERSPFLIDHPDADAAIAVRRLAHRMHGVLNHLAHRGTFFTRSWQDAVARAA